jgi:muramoyltetrapeptide carboxypeptidase
MTQAPATVAFLGLSGYEPSEEVRSRAVGYFEQRGSKVLMLPAADQTVQRFAASRSARLEALGQVLEDPHVELVLSLRGGYGLSQLLPDIDLGRIAHCIKMRRLMLCGYSDFTALSLALLAKTGAVTFSGPAAVSFGAEMVDVFMEQRFWMAQRDQMEALEFASAGPDMQTSGMLWGGNLSMLVSLLGTPYFPVIDGGILFVEDVNEHPYRIERMLLQLLYAGVLQRQHAVLLGRFTNYRLSDYDAGYDLPAVFRELAERLRCPLLPGLPFGHVADKATLPIGRQVELTCIDARARLSFPAAVLG